MEGLKKIVTCFADALFPRSCVVCEEEGQVLCAACEKQVRLPAWHEKTVENLTLFSRVSYKERAVQKLLHAWKYQGDQSAGKWWKLWIAERDQAPTCFAGAMFVPVPLAREAYAERGFNQAEELASALARAHGGICARLLVRTPRKSQAKTQKNERGEIRSENPYALRSKEARAIAATGNAPSVILVDDVTTTGSTLLACADILRTAGWKSVAGCTLAYGNAA